MRVGIEFQWYGNISPHDTIVDDIRLLPNCFHQSEIIEKFAWI